MTLQIGACTDDLHTEFIAQKFYKGNGMRGVTENKGTLVADYKKSSSSSRQKRMEAGYDLQAELYKIMIQSGRDLQA